jgi:tetratricopeptide (TPR) repeat protein
MWKILGDAYCKSDMNEKAVEWYGKYLKAGGAKTADVMFVMMNSVEKASLLKAKMGYEANIKSYPADYRNYLHLGIILSKTKATAQRATALLKKAGDLAGKNSAAWIEIAKAYGRAGKTDDELAAYQTVLSFDNANLYAKTRMGAIYLSRGMTTDAIYVLEEARKQAPDSAGPLVSLASCYMKTGKAKDAVELLVKAKSAKPKDAAVRKLLFEAYRATGKDQQALEEIKAAIDLKRDNESLLAYGKILLKMGKLDSAASVMEDIRSTAPDNVEALMVLAMVLRGQKKFDEAIELYKEISSIDPASAAPLYERAEVYLAQSKMKWAEQFYQRALQTDPKMAAAEVGLAKLARAYGNQAGYMEHLDKASAMDPDNPVVKKEIENSKKPMPAPGKK